MFELLLVPPLLLLAAPSAPTPGPVLDRSVLAMGTRLDLHLEGAPRPVLEAASSALLAEVERLEAVCSTWRPESAWSRLNAAGGEAVPLAPEFLELLGTVQDWNRRTEGAFNPMLGSLMDAWGVRTGGRVPAEAARMQALRASDPGLLVLDRAKGTARLLDPQARLEEGGFLKGYALDAALRVAKRYAIPSGWLDFGGQVLAWGEARAVDVADADDRNVPRLQVPLGGGASLSSSGCSERGRHILDPRTGEPCPDWGAVAVVAPSGLDADILSTSLYVLGPERGPAWAEAQCVAAVFLPHGGAVRTTPAFAALYPTLTPRTAP